MMHNKSQISLFVIIGISAVIILGFSGFLINNLFDDKDDTSLSLRDKSSAQDYLKSCIEDGIKEANIKIGMQEDDLPIYEEHLEGYILSCMSPVILDLESKGMDVTDKGIDVSAEMNEENIIVSVDYDLSFEKGQTILNLDETEHEFRKRVFFSLDEDEAFSSDSNFFASIPEGMMIQNMSGDWQDKVSVYLTDPSLLKNPPEGALIAYALTPTDSYTNKPMKISIMSTSFLGDPEDAEIFWYDQNNEIWGILPSTEESGKIVGKTNYLTYFTLANAPAGTDGDDGDDDDQNLESLNLEYGTEGFGPGEMPEIDENLIPKINFNYYDGNIYSIYEEIRQEMGGTYPLVMNPACTDPPFIQGKTACRSGYDKTCGITAVHCRPQYLPLGMESLNKLFRHEITHNLQHINRGCEGLDYQATREWGAEFVSGTSYYLYSGETLSAEEISKYMISKGCTEEDLAAAAVCLQGSIERLQEKNCTMFEEYIAIW